MSPARVQKADQAGMRQFVDRKEGEIDARFLHGRFLLFRGEGIGMEPEHEGEEHVDDPTDLFRSPVRAGPFQEEPDVLHRPPVGLLEGCQKLLAAVRFHVVIVHGKELQKLDPVRERQGDAVRQCVRRQRSAIGEDALQLLVPQHVFPLIEGKEDLFLRMEIVVDRGPGERRRLADLLERDLLEAHGLVEFFTGVDDLFSSFRDEPWRAFEHGFSFPGPALLTADTMSTDASCTLVDTVSIFLEANFLLTSFCRGRGL